MIDSQQESVGEPKIETQQISERAKVQIGADGQAVTAQVDIKS
jgi:hypothetical protein